MEDPEGNRPLKMCEGAQEVRRPSALARRLLANQQGLLDREGPAKGENLPSAGPRPHRALKRADPLRGAARQLEPQRHLQACSHLAVHLQNRFRAVANRAGGLRPSPRILQDVVLLAC